MTTIDTPLTTADNQIDNHIDNHPDTLYSVSDVAKVLELSRGSLYNRIQKSDNYESFRALGVSGDNNSILYPQSAWSKLLSDIDMSFPEVVLQAKTIEADTPEHPVESTTDTEFETAQIEIYEGNHQTTLANIDLGQQFDLGQLRSPLVEVQSYQDPLAMAQQLINQNSQIVGAMSADLQQRQAKIDQANQALALVDQSNQNLMLQAQQYQIESRVQAAMLNQTTTQLQQKIAIQQNLGKPVGSSSEPSQG